MKELQTEITSFATQQAYSWIVLGVSVAFVLDLTGLLSWV